MELSQERALRTNDSGNENYSKRVTKGVCAMKAILWSVMCIGFSLSLPCFAAAIVVDANGFGDYPTIQAAIMDANDGDEIILLEGVYSGPGNRDISLYGKSVSISSADPADGRVVDSTIIDPNGAQADPHRAFVFDSGENANCILDGITIVGGYAPVADVAGTAVSAGGAILINASSPAITRCRFRDNRADAGGAVFAFESDALFQSCLIIENTAAGGGGLYFAQGAPALNSCIIANNSADRDNGGGICLSATATAITNCTIAHNTAAGYGGGIASYEPLPTINSSIIWNNTAPTHSQLFGINAVTYSDIQDEIAGVGNINADPYFTGPLYDPSIPGLVSHWKFDETAGKVAHDSVGDNHASLRYGATWTNGKIYGALDLDGHDDYALVSGANRREFELHEFTLSFWARVDDPNRGSKAFSYFIQILN